MYLAYVLLVKRPNCWMVDRWMTEDGWTGETDGFVLTSHSTKFMDMDTMISGIILLNVVITIIYQDYSTILSNANSKSTENRRPYDNVFL